MSGDPVTAAPWGLGLYPQADAARYSRIPASTVHRWLVRRGQELAKNGLVSFDQFITLLFVRQLRRRGIRLGEIAKAEADLRLRTGHDHPFAYETLWTAGRDILVRPHEAPDELISANRSGQIVLNGVVDPRVVLIPTDGTLSYTVELPELVSGVKGEVRYTDGRVVQWQPAAYVVASPEVQFGVTCIEGTRLPTRVLFEGHRGGDSNAELARLYHLAEADVERAVAWEQRLAA